jgi:cytochrome c
MKTKTLFSCVVATLFVFVGSGAHAAVDQASAKQLLNQSGCLGCHHETKTKVASSYKKIAASYKGKPGAVAAITKHITEPSQVELGGEVMDHAQVETDDPAQVKNLVNWILSR